MTQLWIFAGSIVEQPIPLSYISLTLTVCAMEILCLAKSPGSKVRKRRALNPKPSARDAGRFFG